MAVFSRTISALVLLLVVFSSCEAKEILVGGKADAWKIPSSQSDSLNQWAESTRFRIGDSLGNFLSSTKLTSLFVFFNHGILFFFFLTYPSHGSVLSQCGNMTVGKTQCCKWTRKAMLAAIFLTPLKSTRMGTPRWSSADLGRSTSSAEPRETVRRVRSWLWWFFLQETGTLVFLRHLLRWSLMVLLLLPLAVLQSCRAGCWLHWGSLFWGCSEKEGKVIARFWAYILGGGAFFYLFWYLM